VKPVWQAEIDTLISTNGSGATHARMPTVCLNACGRPHQNRHLALPFSVLQPGSTFNSQILWLPK